MRHSNGGQTLLSLLLAGVATAVLLAACAQFFVTLTRTFSEERGMRRFHHQILLTDRFLSGLQRNLAAGPPGISRDALQQTVRWDQGALSLHQAGDGSGRLDWHRNPVSGSANPPPMILVDRLDFDASTINETTTALHFKLHHRGQSWTLQLLPLPEYLRDVTLTRK